MSFNAPKRTDRGDLCIKMLQAIANTPDGAGIHVLFDQLSLPWDQGEQILLELLRHRFATIIDRTTPNGGPVQATRQGRDFLARKGLI